MSNTGSLDGDEVVQVYHAAVDIGKVDHPVPKRALRSFQRVRVHAGKVDSVSFDFDSSILEVVNKARRASAENRLLPVIGATVPIAQIVTWLWV